MPPLKRVILHVIHDVAHAAEALATARRETNAYDQIPILASKLPLSLRILVRDTGFIYIYT